MADNTQAPAQQQMTPDQVAALQNILQQMGPNSGVTPQQGMSAQTTADWAQNNPQSLGGQPQGNQGNFIGGNSNPQQAQQQLHPIQQAAIDGLLSGVKKRASEMGYSNPQAALQSVAPQNQQTPPMSMMPQQGQQPQMSMAPQQSMMQQPSNQKISSNSQVNTQQSPMSTPQGINTSGAQALSQNPQGNNKPNVPSNDTSNDQVVKNQINTNIQNQLLELTKNPAKWYNAGIREQQVGILKNMQLLAAGQPAEVAKPLAEAAQASQEAAYYKQHADYTEKMVNGTLPMTQESVGKFTEGLNNLNMEQVNKMQDNLNEQVKSNGEQLTDLETKQPQSHKTLQWKQWNAKVQEVQDRIDKANILMKSVGDKYKELKIISPMAAALKQKILNNAPKGSTHYDQPSDTYFGADGKEMK